MFQEGDWNDSSDAQALTESLKVNGSSASTSLRAGVSHGTGRKKTTKQLLETLRLLECSSKATKDITFLGPKDASGSEDSSTEAVSVKTKRKKKRSKRKTKVLHSDGSVSEPQAFAVKRKSSEPESSEITWKKRQSKDPIGNFQKEKDDAAESHTDEAEGKVSTATQLSRKQWKNKQKNKKRNKNKFNIVLEPSEGSRQTEQATAENRISKFAKQQIETLSRTRDTKHSKQSTVSVKVKENVNSVAFSSNKPAVNKPAEMKTTTSKYVTSESSSKVKRRKLSKLKEMLQRSGQEVLGSGEDGNNDAAGKMVDQNTEVTETESSVGVSADRSATLRAKMEERLKSARFRYINQQLYTTSSREAQALFQKDPEAFNIYHRGFSTQVERWPENPVDLIIKYLRNRPASLVVADFGCGDCKIARSVRNTVHSFDLVALNKHVTVCDMAKVPLSDESVDIVVFCLALMGTNLQDFLAEANRILKQGGVLKVAEVASRFEDVRVFLTALAGMGFKNLAKDTENSYFYMFEFTKTGPPKVKGNLPGLQLKACLYKKR